MPVFDNGDERASPALARARGRVAHGAPGVRGGARGEPGRDRSLINDFDLSPAYERLIEEVLDAGIRDRRDRAADPHAPGLPRRGGGRSRSLDRFARFGLPLHMTETTLRLRRTSCRRRSTT